MDSSKLIGEASKLGFVPNVEIHSDLEIKIGLEFENPDILSVGGVARIEIDVRELSIFKSAITLKPMNL